MTMWLYQINQELWSPGRLRLELWEGERWSWPTRKFRTSERPDPGDTVVFYCAKSGGADPGFYGWAVVTEFYKDAELLYFTPAAPTNYLKMVPWWDGEAENLADRIRGRMKQATLWRIDDKERDQLRAGGMRRRATLPLSVRRILEALQEGLHTIACVMRIEISLVAFDAKAPR